MQIRALLLLLCTAWAPFSLNAAGCGGGGSHVGAWASETSSLANAWSVPEQLTASTSTATGPNVMDKLYAAARFVTKQRNVVLLSVDAPALMPLVEEVTMSDAGVLECSRGTDPATCNTVLALVRRLLSMSYLLTSSAAAPEPGNVGRYAAQVYRGLQRVELAARSYSISASQLKAMVHK